MTTLSDSLSAGRGIYSAEEAAFYARIPPITMKRWLAEDPAHPGVIRQSSDERGATFIDFVQAMAIRSIRAHRQISIQKIRAAVLAAAQRGIKDIFAREHTTYWDGKEIHVLEAGGNFRQLTGAHIDQTSCRPIVEIYMRDLTFGEDGLACKYDAFNWNDHKIEMCPKTRFGEPVVVSCGYTARVLWEACETEGSVEAAARAYGVTVEEAEVAARYYDHLTMKLAA
jgi:uncharacterized protein (DUF433 family)